MDNRVCSSTELIKKMCARDISLLVAEAEWSMKLQTLLHLVIYAANICTYTVHIHIGLVDDCIHSTAY